MTPALSPLKALEEKWRKRGKNYCHYKDAERNKDFEATANLHADELSAVRETVEQEMADNRTELASLRHHCTQYENDREYNAELVRERDATISALRAQLTGLDEVRDYLDRYFSGTMTPAEVQRVVDYRSRGHLEWIRAALAPSSAETGDGK